MKRERGSDVIRWRGHQCTRKDRAFMLSLERKIGPVTIYQMGNRTDVDDSAGTHSKYNVIDYSPNGISWSDATREDRQLGGTGWHRTPRQGFMPHIHTVIGPGGMAAPLARGQWDNYLQGGDGLGSFERDDDPQQYRPKPQVYFSYTRYRRQHRLAERIADLTTRISTWRHKIRQAQRKRKGLLADREPPTTIRRH